MPGSMRFHSAGGLHLAYAEEGPPDAPAVVLLHGWASSWRMWRTTVDALAPTFRCVSLDLPGHGSSDKPAWEWYTIDRFSQAVDDIRCGLGLERVALVGHSMGGTIALDLAARPEADIERLVLVNPVVTGETTQLARPITERWIRPVVGVSRHLWPVASRLLTRPPASVRSRLPDHVVRNQEDLAQTTADSALGSIRAVLRWDVQDRLQRVLIPTLVVVGDSDHTVPPREGALAAREIRGARLVRMACGHHPSDEAPQAFLDVLASFLGPMRDPRV